LHRVLGIVARGHGPRARGTRPAGPAGTADEMRTWRRWMRSRRGGAADGSVPGRAGTSCDWVRYHPDPARRRVDEQRYIRGVVRPAGISCGRHCLALPSQRVNCNEGGDQASRVDLPFDTGDDLFISCLFCGKILCAPSLYAFPCSYIKKTISNFL
jgi:hypothetical protein